MTRRTDRARARVGHSCYAVLARGILGLLAVTRIASAQVSVSAPLPAQLTLSTSGETIENRIAARALREAYRRLGVSIALAPLPGDSGINQVEAGMLDGDIARIDGTERVRRNLVQVAVPVGFLDVVVFARDPAVRIRGWEDLRSVRVGLVHGSSAAEKSASALRVRMVDTHAELDSLFASGELDAIVLETMNVSLLRRVTPTLRIAPLPTVLDTYLLYHYVHARHAAIGAQVEPILRTMLLDGSIARIRDAAVAEFSGSVP